MENSLQIYRSSNFTMFFTLHLYTIIFFYTQHTQEEEVIYEEEEDGERERERY